MIRSVLAGVAAMFVIAAPVNAATYTVTESVPAVVWVSDVAPDPASGIEIRQTMKAFAPSFVIVPIGTTILFPNDDAFYHSVYSESPGNAVVRARAFASSAPAWSTSVATYTARCTPP
jgi:plastocyanin